MCTVYVPETGRMSGSKNVPEDTVCEARRSDPSGARIRAVALIDTLGNRHETRCPPIPSNAMSASLPAV